MQYEELRRFDLIYLATPYTLYEHGLDAAAREAAQIAAKLMRLKVRAFSPIAHGHQMTVHGGVDAGDHFLWRDYNAGYMALAGALLVAQLPGWEKSAGIADEMQTFHAAGKPIRFLDPATMGVDHIALVAPAAVAING